MQDSESIITANNASHERLQAFAERLTDEELAQPLGNGWTAGAIFGHLAFWDARALVLVERWERGERRPSPMDVHAANDALLPQWLVLPPRVAADLAISQAKQIDAKMAALSPEQFAAFAQDAVHLELAIDRSEHRNEHLDELAAVLGKTGR
jgi:hypothetical protein